MKKRLAVHLVYFTALTLVIGIMAAVAGEVTIPNTFKPNTTAKAGEVNDNFTAIKNAVDDNFARLPIMWAQTDVSETGALGNTPAPIDINIVNINAPSTGSIVISGNVHIDSHMPQLYVLLPYVDGSEVPAANTFTAAHYSPSTAFFVDQFTLSYTIAVPIPEGLHSVTQRAGPASFPADFFYNKNHLTVVFYPQTQGMITNAPEDDTFGIGGGL